MVDINDIIFEKYREGKIDSQEMVLLLESSIKKESNKKRGTTMDDSIFQNVFNLIQDYLPDGWKKQCYLSGILLEAIQ